MVVKSINLDIDPTRLSQQPQIVQDYIGAFQKLHRSMQAVMAERTQIKQLGMILDLWKHKSCEARIGVGEEWATVYDICSDDPGKGHATELLIAMKAHYEEQGKTFGSTVALSDPMKHLLVKLNIPEYKN